MRRLVFALFLLLPLAAAAQEARKIPTVAWLSWWGGEDNPRSEGFREAMRSLGHVEGATVRFEWHWAGGSRERAAAIAADLVRREVDLIVAQATPAAHAAKAATTTIPIVMTTADPLATGLVTNLARPGGNITGVSIFSPEVAPKRLELLRDLVPRLRRVAFLGSTRDPNTQTFVRETETAAATLGIAFHPVLVDGPGDFEAAFMEMAREGAQALILQPIWYDHRAALAELALGHVLPMAGDTRRFAEAGALLSYGQDWSAGTRRVAAYVDRILKGEKPGELPIEAPAEHELVINMKTAGALGITVPGVLLLRANEIIE